METNDDLLKILEGKKEKLSALTNDLLGLYRKLLEEKIDYKEENKYDNPISKKREKIKELETEILDIEKRLKRAKKVKKSVIKSE